MATQKIKASTQVDFDGSDIVNGWNAISGLSYSSADSPTFVIATTTDLTAIIGVGDRIKLTQTTVKYFIVTAITASTITVYGGTDYTLVNAAITDAYYSHMKRPVGFPIDKTKWTIEMSSTSDATQASPTANVWYNLGSLSITIHIGAWDVECMIPMACAANAAAINQFFTLSTANNSESDINWTAFIAIIFPSAGVSNTIYAPLFRKNPIVETSKTTHYLNSKTTNSGVGTLYFTGSLSKIIVRAISAYL